MSEQNHMRPPQAEFENPAKQELITGVPSFEDNPNDAPSPNDMPVYVYPEESPLPTQTNEIVDEDPDWGYTRSAKEFFGEKFGGRQLIGRDSKIDGGVYFGTYGGEAIVVDTEKYPTQFNAAFELAKQKASNEEGEVQRSKVLEAVFETVSEKMKYSQAGVDKLLGELAQANGSETFVDGTKVNLGDFLEDGIGVCRHQALVVGALLEKMKEAGHIRGNVSVDRNERWSPKGEREGHAWVRYTSNAGDIMIIDVAQGYFGLLEESEGRLHGWDYLRPEEQRARAAQDIGRSIAPEVMAR